MEFRKTSKALQRFLGTINYSRCWIPNAAELQSPLNCLLNDCTRKELQIVSTSEVVEAFDKYKSLLNVARSTYPPPHSCQQLVDNEQQPIAFFSKKLTGTEGRYNTYDRELLAIYKIIFHFQHFLDGSTFTIFCDHKPLMYAFQRKNRYRNAPPTFNISMVSITCLRACFRELLRSLATL